jgi:hypothetical protein
LRYLASRLRPATRSPGDASPEVLFPFSAINTTSPFLGTGRRRLLTASWTPAAGLPHPRHFHLQGFSPSWRLSPRGTLPVCFTRQALLGFRARLSISTRRATRRRLHHLAQQGRERTRDDNSAQWRCLARKSEDRATLFPAPRKAHGAHRGPSPSGSWFAAVATVSRHLLSSFEANPNHRRGGEAKRLGFAASSSRPRRTGSALKHAAAPQSLNEQATRPSSLEEDPPSWGSLAQQSPCTEEQKPRQGQGRNR